jgi:hypothetical protein
MPEHSALSGDPSSAEEIKLDFRLKNLLELSNFPSARLEELLPVRNVQPCSECTAPVAFVHLGYEYRWIDCFRDEARSREFAPAWNGNILQEHRCAAGSQQ